MRTRPYVEVSNLVKEFGKKTGTFRAIDDISLQITKGETVAIVGKSGSGKSTLMHLISGLDRPTFGSITIGGNNLADMNSKDVDKFRANEMSFIFQAFFIEPNQTCYQNVVLPLEIAKINRRERKELAGEALAAVGLEEKVNERAVNFSGGQKQRLAIARSIVNKPKLLFADEPTGNLDSTTGEKIINLLLEQNKTLGSTLIVVTHDHELAERCQRQINIKDGVIVDKGQA